MQSTQFSSFLSLSTDISVLKNKINIDSPIFRFSSTVSVFFGTKVTWGTKVLSKFQPKHGPESTNMYLRCYCLLRLFPMPHLSTFFHVTTQVRSVDRQFFVPSPFFMEFEELFTALPTARLAFARQATTLKQEEIIII